MSDPIRCIFVGTKNRGAMIVKAFVDHARQFSAVGLVDATSEIAQGAAAELKLDAPCFDSLARAAGAVQADAAVITSPARFHAQQIGQALDANLHVFVAKPMTYDLDEAVALVSKADERCRCIVVDQQQRYMPSERVMAQWVREKKYGAVGFAQVQIHRYRPKVGQFTGDNPFIWEQGVHSFNSLLGILDRPAVRVTARQIKPAWSSYNGPTVAMGLIEFAGDLPCVYTGTFDSRNLTNEIRLECEAAAVRAFAVNSFHKRLEVALPGAPFEPCGINDADDPTSPESFNIENFHRGIVDGTRVPNDGRDNLRTLAVVDAFIRSARSGRAEDVRKFD